MKILQGVKNGKKLDKALKDFVSPVASGAIKSITISTGDVECKIDELLEDKKCQNKKNI